MSLGDAHDDPWPLAQLRPPPGTYCSLNLRLTPAVDGPPARPSVQLRVDDGDGIVSLSTWDAADVSLDISGGDGGPAGLSLPDDAPVRARLALTVDPALLVGAIDLAALRARPASTSVAMARALQRLRVVAAAGGGDGG